MKNLLFLILLFPLLISCQTEKAVNAYPAHVGDISFDKNIDDPDFKKCQDKEFGIQYYYGTESGIQYNGEKLAIIVQLEKSNIKSSKGTNGYITVRFLVNCEGKTGMFRVQQMNKEYQEEGFDQELADKLLTFTKGLKGWAPKKFDGKKVDYYQYLTFKIEDGQVSEILP